MHLRFTFFLLLIFSAQYLTAQQKLPAFFFTDLEGNTFGINHIKQDVPTIAFFFDPYCDHCAKQAEWIAEEADKFAGVQMLWVTTEQQEPVQGFYDKHFKGKGLPMLHMLRDKDFMFDTYFGYSEAPSIYIYNSSGKRVKALSEETPAAKLLELIQKGEK